MSNFKQQDCNAFLVRPVQGKQNLPEIINSIVESCHPDDVLSHLDVSALPSISKIKEIITDLESTLYPGYFGNQEMERANLPYYIGMQVNRVYENLASQITRVFTHFCTQLNESACQRCGEQGESNALELLKKIPEIRKMLTGDVLAAFDSDPAAKNYYEIIFSYPGVQAITVYRLAHELHNQGVPILPRIMSEYAHGITGIDIHPGAKIGRNFFIDHGTGVVIGETTEIGDNVRIYQGVTLGALSVEDAGSLRHKKRHPTIEDDVTIYAGATILGGNVVIGKGSTIGGNVWLVDSVKPGTLVSVKPQRYSIKSRESTSQPGPDD